MHWKPHRLRGWSVGTLSLSSLDPNNLTSRLRNTSSHLATEGTYMTTTPSHLSASVSPVSSPRTSGRASPLPESNVSHTTAEEDVGEDGDEDGDEDEVNESEDSESDSESGDEEDEADDDKSDSEEESDSGKIAEKLARILESGFEFHGSFYTSRAYPNAPNPCLSLDGLGSVALPLATSAATSIIDLCGQAPFGKGNETIIDAKVRDTWEMGPSKVKFENAAWNQWINETVIPQACEALGVDSSTGRVTTELYKLLLYEKGSHFLPHKDTEKAPGMFATIVITLPSQFTGGSIHLEHALKTKVVNMSSDSAFSTQVAAWYTDVMHSVQPILSGYRLVLSYNLIHAIAPSLRPALTTTSLHAKKLRRVLKAWKKNQTPQKVVYLFDHQYSSSNLLGATLKGKDAHIIRNVRSIAEPLGFRIYVANIQLYRKGTDVGDDYYGEDWDREFGESSWSANSLVDLQGNPVDIENLKIKNKYVVPYLLTEEAPDQESKEGYTGNAPGDIELWYRRTGLILWPAELDLENVDDELIEFASAHLSKSTTTKPTKSEAALIQGLVDCLPKTKQISRKRTVLYLIRQAAVRWRIPRIWLNAYEEGKVAMDISFVGSRSLAEDLDVFGFEVIGDFLNLAIKNSRNDSDRFELLAQITHVAERGEDKELMQWVVNHRVQVCRSLHRPNKDLVHYLLTEITQHGCSLLVDVILPQLENQLPPYEFWTPFLLGLHNAAMNGKIPPNFAVVSDAITSILQKVIPYAKTFPRSKVSSAGREKLEPKLEDWMGPITICLSTGHVPLVQEYFSRMLQDLGNMSAAMKSWAGTTFFPAAMRNIDTLAFARSSGDQSVKDALALFWQMALKSYVEEILLLAKGERLDEKLVLRALRGGGNCDQLKTQLLTDTNISYSRALLLKNLALSLHHEMQHPDQHDRLMVDSVKNLITEISIHLAKFAPLSSESSTHTPEKREIMSLLDLIFSVDSMQSMQSLKSLNSVLERLLKHQTNEDSLQGYMEQSLLPTLTRLLTEFKARGISLPFEPVSTFSAKTVEQYIHRLVGSDPSAILPSMALRKFGCGCANCLSLRRFFTNRENMVSFREVKYIRSHIEDMLRNSGASRDGFKWSTLTGPTPHVLQVYKPADYVQKYGLAARRRKGIQVLNMLGDPSIQEQVLGERWPVICITLGLHVRPVIAHSSNQTQEPTASISDAPQDPQTSGAGASTSATNLPSRKRAFEDAAGPSSGATAFKKPKPSTKPLEIIDISD